MRRHLAWVVVATVGLAAELGAQSVTLPADEFVKSNAEWREWRLERLTSETGWLTLIGLHWLVEGDNALGSEPGSRLPLPAEKALSRTALLRNEGGIVTLLPEAGSGLSADGKPVTTPLPLATDAAEKPTLLELGSLNFFLVERGERVGLRLRDREAKLRREFVGLDYFPPDPALRVEARFTANPPGTTMAVATVLGTTEQMPSPGKLTFTLSGEERTIVALDDTGDGRLYLIFGDATNGHETYGAGRFLYADPPANGVAIVDFNRAYNPPCAFTPWSTCQLPPKENRLALRIEAGEKKYAGALHP